MCGVAEISISLESISNPHQIYLSLIRSLSRSLLRQTSTGFFTAPRAIPPLPMTLPAAILHRLTVLVPQRCIAARGWRICVTAVAVALLRTIPGATAISNNDLLKCIDRLLHLLHVFSKTLSVFHH